MDQVRLDFRDMQSTRSIDLIHPDHADLGNKYFQCADVVGIDEDEDIYAGTDISVASIDKDKNVSDGSGDTAADKVDRNIRKQLKVSKSKVFMAIINHKKSHLLKEILATKFS